MKWVIPEISVAYHNRILFLAHVVGQRTIHSLSPRPEKLRLSHHQHMISRVALGMNIQIVARRPEIDLLTEWCSVPDLQVVITSLTSSMN